MSGHAIPSPAPEHLAASPAPGRVAPLPAPGHMGVDYEERLDFDRLRRYRLDRARAALESSECGAFLLFDFYNIRYTTQTWIGGALGDKMTRYALLTRSGGPTLWDFGSAARHHRLHSPWLDPSDSRAGGMASRRCAAALRTEAEPSDSSAIARLIIALGMSLLAR